MSLFMFAFGMYWTSQHATVDHIKRYLFLGMGLFTIGLGLSSLMPNLWIFVLSYGAMMGFGVGAIYGIALMIINLSDFGHKGLLSGSMLFAFGASSSILAPIATQYILANSLQALFLLYMLIAIILSIILSIVIIKMPKIEKDLHKGEVKPWGNMLILMSIMTLITLTMIGLTGKIAIDYYGYDKIDVSVVIAIFALFNALARPLFGQLFDSNGFRKSAYLSLILLILATMINIVNLGKNPVLFFIGYGLYWFNLGAWLSLMPQLVLSTYGKYGYTKTYGFVYLGYGIGALIGTFISGYILDVLNSTLFVYIGLALLLIPAYLLIQKLSTK
jgi:MFS family permease